MIALLGAMLVYSAPQPQEPIAIISQDSNIEPDGSYQYSYETANGIKGQETGTLKRSNSPDAADVIVAQGSVSYTDPDGNIVNLSYSADDENGFVSRVWGLGSVSVELFERVEKGHALGTAPDTGGKSAPITYELYIDSLPVNPVWYMR